MSRVTDLLAALRAGEKSLDEVAAAFRTYRWPKNPVPVAKSFAELAAREEQDPEPLQDGSFDEVAVAYTAGQITDEQYARLAEAAGGKAKT